MNVCDKCRVARGIVLWWNEDLTDVDHDGDILLCGHHSDANAHALVAAGFQIFEDERDDEDSCTVPALTADPLTH